MENQSATPRKQGRPTVRGLVIILGLLSFGLAATHDLGTCNADLAWTGLFYQEGGPNAGWAYGQSVPWITLYDYGEIPTLILFAAALAIYTASWFGKVAAEHRKPCLAVILTVILGPGLLVNGVFKNYWGRPRPVEIAAFGGPWEFRTPGEPGIPGQGKSFTCGHCAMAFALASGAAWYPLHRGVGLVFLATGVVYGIMMGVARMAQGGHFPTDVVWSGVIVFVVLTALYYLVLRIPRQEPSPAARSRKGTNMSEPA